MQKKKMFVFTVVTLLLLCVTANVYGGNLELVHFNLVTIVDVSAVEDIPTFFLKSNMFSNWMFYLQSRVFEWVSYVIIQEIPGASFSNFNKTAAQFNISLDHRNKDWFVVDINTDAYVAVVTKTWPQWQREIVNARNRDHGRSNFFRPVVFVRDAMLFPDGVDIDMLNAKVFPKKMRPTYGYDLQQYLNFYFDKLPYIGEEKNRKKNSNTSNVDNLSHDRLFGTMDFSDSGFTHFTYPSMLVRQRENRRRHLPMQFGFTGDYLDKKNLFIRARANINSNLREALRLKPSNSTVVEAMVMGQFPYFHYQSTIVKCRMHMASFFPKQSFESAFRKFAEIAYYSQFDALTTYAFHHERNNYEWVLVGHEDAKYNGREANAEQMLVFRAYHGEGFCWDKLTQVRNMELMAASSNNTTMIDPLYYFCDFNNNKIFNPYIVPLGKNSMGVSTSMFSDARSEFYAAYHNINSTKQGVYDKMMQSLQMHQQQIAHYYHYVDITDASP